MITKYKALLLTCLLSALTTVQAHAKPIGDLNLLFNWSGLQASDELSPDGAATARLQTPGKASFVYTEPKNYLSGLTPSFADMLKSVQAEDWYDYNYLTFQLYLPDDRPVQLECTIHPLHIGRPDYVDALSSTLTLHGKGWQKAVYSLKDFEYIRNQGTFWKLIHSVSLSATHSTPSDTSELRISQPRLQKGKALALSSPVRSQPVEAGQGALYELQIENESLSTLHITLVLESTGWEGCPAELSQSQLMLAPGEQQTVQLSVQMNERLPPGGREQRTVTVIPDGRADLKEEINFITVRSLPHPYLLHTEAGWDRVREKTETVEWARKSKADYIEIAEKWRVPEPRSNGDYCYRGRPDMDLIDCAIAWKLTGSENYAEKIVQFLRGLSDPERGYPTTNQINNGSHVHRGMFFMHVAQAYDLIHDHPSLSDADHENIEHSMRLYNEWVNYQVLTGDGNNHQASLVTAAILNGLVIQDFTEVDRFLHGKGGLLNLIGQGILDDCHYFEGTINYNLLVGNIFNTAALALEPWGLNLKEWKVPARYGKFVMISDWAMRGDFLGMSFEREGPITRSHRKIKDIWDAVIPTSDWRGVVFPSSDSVAIDLKQGHREAGFGVEAAYYLWEDPAYIPLLEKIEQHDLLYGPAQLPESDGTLGEDTFVSDNVGFAVLRSKQEDPRERYQTVQRYGTHGGYHGHFDKTSLLSLSRFGRTQYGTEASWYGYWSFMFKMWVQASNAHNMTVVDHRMQKPNTSTSILFHDGELMQASATEIETVWIDPPYGGQTPYALKMPEEKTWQEARWLPTPKNPRPQGNTGTPSEPVMQRRLLIQTNDYVLVADYLKGNETHDFDNVFNCKGLVGFTAEEKTFLKHTPQCDSDPYSSAQFITDCDWYSTKGTAKVAFVLDWSKGEMGGRMSHSEPGVMNVDYYSLWPKEATIMIGSYPETYNVARHLYYEIRGDGEVLSEGKLAPWILGQVDIDLDVTGVKSLEIETRLDKARDLQTIFLGSPELLDASGDSITYQVDSENIAPAAGENLDYAGGEVTIFGTAHSTSIAAEPKDRKQPGILRIDLFGKEAKRFQATLGGDYPVGGDDIHRKVIATRSTGTEARFLSAIEFHEDSSVIQSIQALSHNEIQVERTDGTVEHFKISGLESGAPVVQMEKKDGNRVIAAESTETTTSSN